MLLVVESLSVLLRASQLKVTVEKLQTCILNLEIFMSQENAKEHVEEEKTTNVTFAAKNVTNAFTNDTFLTSKHQKYSITFSTSS